MKNWSNRFTWVGIVALGVWSVAACQEEIVAILDGDLVPVEAVTVEVELPYHDFAMNFQGWGGYGRAFELNEDVVAKAFEGSLDARVLNSWFPFPSGAQVRDSAGLVKTDTLLTYVGARLVARFDTLSSIRSELTELAIGAVQQTWDFVSADWDVAVDSVGEREEWTEGGAGPVVPLATALWEPALGDSVVFDLDSAGVALLSDTAAARRGIRLDALTDGVRLNLTGLDLWLVTKPSVHPDTLVELEVATRARTFVFWPVLDDPVDEIWVGGVPAWRSVFEMNLPEVLEGPESLCQQVQCPLRLTPGSLVSASLVLTTKDPPAGFQPSDTLFLDVRPVLAPDRLPKSPLGSSLLISLGALLPPGIFGDEVGTELEVQLGPYVQNLIAENTPEGLEGLGGLEVPHTLAFLSSFEPLSLSLASFEGPDSPLGPRLRLVLTLAEDVLIR